jgi:hypothetical protein
MGVRVHAPGGAPTMFPMSDAPALHVVGALAPKPDYDSLITILAT